MKNTLDSTEEASVAESHWAASLKLIVGCLFVWFVVSYGFGVIFVDQMNQFSFAGFKLGFWFAQQGSIYTFVALIFFYAWRMNRIDSEHGVRED